MRRVLVVGTIVVLVLTLALKPHPAYAAAIPDPTTFWNALKVALGGGVISTATLATAGEFAAAGLIVGGVVVGGYLIVKAYQRWRTANQSAGSWENYYESVANGAWFMTTNCVNNNPPGWWSAKVRYGFGPASEAYNVTHYTSLADGLAACQADLASWAATSYAVWASNVNVVGESGGPVGGNYWPGTTVTTPTDVAVAIADPRWSTIAGAVAGQLDEALQADRDARAISIPGNTEGYQSPWDIGFSNVRVGDQPVVGNPPTSPTPTQPATEGYLAQVIQWLGDVFRTQLQWLGGVIETWQSRVVTELEQVGDMIATLPAQIADAVKVKVGEALQEAFVPQQATLTQFEALRTTLATKPPFSLVPPAALFPDIAPGTCAMPSVNASFMGQGMTLEWPSFVCEYALKFRVFMLGLFWVSIGLFVVGRVWPRVVF